MVSDTAMFDQNGQPFALAPVLRELESLSLTFERITWIGFKRPEYRGNAAFSPVQNPKIRLIWLDSCGGDRFRDKLEVLARSPGMAFCILREIFRHGVVYTRAPSAPAFIATLLSVFFPKKIFWHKYAGNWAQPDAPRFFAFQRRVLSRASNSKVTLNGKWPAQPAHCLSFENPCLDQAEIERGKAILAQKNYSEPLVFCFVGRLETAKGVHWILEAFRNLDSNPRIGTLHLVGDGPLRPECEALAKKLRIKVLVHGFLGPEQVHQVMAASHILLLPSKAEGLPKVLAEGANMGCIPIITDVSCIGQYIRHGENGFLLEPERLPEGQLAEIMDQLPAAEVLAQIAARANQLCPDFSYEHFVGRVQREILGFGPMDANPKDLPKQDPEP
jgi:glycosyltransferase involved in cell wall biosynthesis